MSILSEGRVLAERYQIVAHVGTGGMQEVYEAYDRTLDRAVALKVPLNTHTASRFRQTAILSAKVNHPNVAKTLDYFADEEREYLVEDYVFGEDLRKLFTLFERFDPHAAAYVLHHLAKGMAASHNVGVVHRDLKPSNVMVVGGLNFDGIKITDFGIAKMAEDEVQRAVPGLDEVTKQSSTVVGAMAYYAPEVITSPHTPSKAADIWAISAIAWELLVGNPPFGGGLNAVPGIVSGTPPSLQIDMFGRQFRVHSQRLAEVILPCFRTDPNDRPTADELVDLCADLCYLPPRRETGTVGHTNANDSHGFITPEGGGNAVFFHRDSVIGGMPGPFEGVWFGKFDGHPNPRAMPVVPLKDGKDSQNASNQTRTA